MSPELISVLVLVQYTLLEFTQVSTSIGANGLHEVPI